MTTLTLQHPPVPATPVARAVVTFVVPVRHPDNAKNWRALMTRLAETAQSIASQTDAGWHGIVVANTGVEIPALPSGFEVVRVTFPPNPMHDLTPENREAVYEAFRLDKGRRVLAGMLAAPPSDYFMIVDDDDFVSRELVAYVRAHRGAPGWFVGHGYVWSEGGRVVYLHPDFAGLCGTSHIVRSDLYRLPASLESADLEQVKSMLGSHIRIEKRLADEGNALVPLPFAGAVYRVGHAEAHSKSRSVLRTFVANRQVLRAPHVALRNLLRLRPLSAIARDFGMLQRQAAPL